MMAITAEVLVSLSSVTVLPSRLVATPFPEGPWHGRLGLQQAGAVACVLSPIYIYTYIHI